MNIKSTTLSVFAVSLIGACAPETSGRTIGNLPAGSDVVGGDFGRATTNNIQVSAVSERIKYIKGLTRLFAAEAPATINFAFNSASLDSAAKADLRAQAEWIIAHPQITFRVYGHTDKVGSNSYNQRLGLRRAKAAVNYLISQGVDKNKVEAVVSFGETRPLVLTQGRSRENRRTATEVKGFYNPANDGLLDGKVAEGIYRRYVGEAPSVTVETTN